MSKRPKKDSGVLSPDQASESESIIGVNIPRYISPSSSLEVSPLGTGRAQQSREWVPNFPAFVWQGIVDHARTMLETLEQENISQPGTHEDEVMRHARDYLTGAQNLLRYDTQYHAQYHAQYHTEYHTLNNSENGVWNIPEFRTVELAGQNEVPQNLNDVPGDLRADFAAEE